MKKCSFFAKFIVVFMLVFSMASAVLAIELNEVAPKMENATRIANRGQDKIVPFGKYKWIKKDTGRWSLNLDTSNEYLFASNGFFDVWSFTSDGKPDVAVYYFDNVGSLLTGWAKDDDGNYYFFDYVDGPSLGRMCSGWRKIGDAWYYFGPDGKLYVNEMTPDGFKVGIDGNLVNKNNSASRYSKKYGSN